MARVFSKPDSQNNWQLCLYHYTCTLDVVLVMFRMKESAEEDVSTAGSSEQKPNGWR